MPRPATTVSCGWVVEMATLHHRTMLLQDYALLTAHRSDDDRWAGLDVTRIVPHGLQARSKWMPGLVALQAMTQNARLALLEQAEAHDRRSDTRFFGALLISKTDQASLVRHLARSMVVRIPGGGDALLRLHDPAVFTHLAWQLDARQMDRLLGPIAVWSWPTVERKWQHVQRGAAATGALRLQPEQWDHLTRIGALNRALRHLRRKGIERTDSDSFARTVDALLARAYARDGLAEEDDVLLYVEQAVLVHADVHRHPELASRLAQVRNGSASYLGACASVDTAQLQQWAQSRIHHGKELT